VNQQSNGYFTPTVTAGAFNARQKRAEVRHAHTGAPDIEQYMSGVHRTSRRAQKSELQRSESNGIGDVAGAPDMSGVHRTVRCTIQQTALSAFRDRGVPKPTSECAACPSPDGSSAWASAKGGEARWPSRGLRVRPAPRSGALAVGGLQASTRVREASGPKRASVSSSSPRGQPSLRRPWPFLL
jgi:hypothetical protein